jgi:hypothetical protein
MAEKDVEISDEQLRELKTGQEAVWAVMDTRVDQVYEILRDGPSTKEDYELTVYCVNAVFSELITRRAVHHCAKNARRAGEPKEGDTGAEKPNEEN